MQPNFVQHRLLQRCAAWHTEQHHPETAASQEQCSSSTVLQATRRSCAKLHWLPVQQPITYKLTVVKYRVRRLSTPSYLWDRITERVCSWTPRSLVIPLLIMPFTRTDFSRRDFRLSAPSLWKSLAHTWLFSDCLPVFKSRLKIFLFTRAFTKHQSNLLPVSLQLRSYGTVCTFDYYYYC